MSRSIRMLNNIKKCSQTVRKQELRHALKSFAQMPWGLYEEFYLVSLSQSRPRLLKFVKTKQDLQCHLHVRWSSGEGGLQGGPPDFVSSVTDLSQFSLQSCPASLVRSQSYTSFAWFPVISFVFTILPQPLFPSWTIQPYKHWVSQEGLVSSLVKDTHEPQKHWI